MNLLIAIFIEVRSVFVYIEAKFERELQRLISRIQILASKGELADLLVLEAKVRDESTLKQFLDHLEAIATRHKVENLCESFQLWRV